MAASESKKTFKLVRNIMNIKKMFKGRNRKKKKDQYDPEQVNIKWIKDNWNYIITMSYSAKLFADVDCWEISFWEDLHLSWP